MPHVFISRQLEPESPLLAYASKAGLTVTARSLLTFAPLPFRAPLNAQVWFFYSPRAVEFSLDSLDQVTTLPKIAAMGAGTAKYLEENGWPVDFVGAGDPVEVTQQFMEAFAGGSVFFPRARQSRKSVQRMLTDNYQVLDAVCYDNVAVTSPEPVDADVYVFTSPLNAQSYLNHHRLPNNAQVIAIGPSTSSALGDLGISHITAVTPSETGIIKALENLEKSR